jgi:uncharacterized membrane protein
MWWGPADSFYWRPGPSPVVPLTLKNVYGIVGIAAIALLWTAIVGILGGVVVVALVVVLIVVLNAVKRKRMKPGTEAESQK